MRALLLSCLAVAAVAACNQAEEPGPAATAETPATPAPIAPGRYCAVEDLGDMGQAVAEATVAGEGDARQLTVSSAMPDSGQVLEAGPQAAEIDSEGKLHFAFEDGWGNRGTAVLSPAGRLVLTVVQPSDQPMASNVGRNYGEFDLTAQACSAIKPAA